MDVRLMSKSAVVAAHAAPGMRMALPLSRPELVGITEVKAPESVVKIADHAFAKNIFAGVISLILVSGFVAVGTWLYSNDEIITTFLSRIS